MAFQCGLHLQLELEALLQSPSGSQRVFHQFEAPGNARPTLLRLLSPEHLRERPNLRSLQLAP